MEEQKLYKWSWSHDQDGRHANIWYICQYTCMVKNLKKPSPSEQWNDFHETWHVPSRTPSHHRFFYKLWPLVDLDLIYARVKFVYIGFSIGKK